MLPLGIFTRQFTAANLITFVVYAALGGVFFLLVSFLQISLGYTPLAAGAASLPVTALMLLFSSWSGSLAQKIGPRWHLTAGPLLIAAGLVLMARITPGDGYAASVLPAVLVFGAGLTLVVSPITATVLASASERHSGIASGVNNAVARVASLLAVALLPPIAGLTGNRFYVPDLMNRADSTSQCCCAQPFPSLVARWPGSRSTIPSSRAARHPRAEMGSVFPARSVDRRCEEEKRTGVGGPMVAEGRRLATLQKRGRSRFVGNRCVPALFSSSSDRIVFDRSWSFAATAVSKPLAYGGPPPHGAAWLVDGDCTDQPVRPARKELVLVGLLTPPF